MCLYFEKKIESILEHFIKAKYQQLNNTIQPFFFITTENFLIATNQYCVTFFH